jgi:nucleotide-binding universal stress UspA family protein
MFMSLANIMVSVDLGAEAPRRVRLAAGLAERFEADLTGVAARRIPGPEKAGDFREAQSRYSEEQGRLVDDLASACAIFGGNAGTQVRTDWRQAEARPAAFLVEQARFADLVVVGRLGPDDDAAADLGVEPGPVLMEAGRPVLVVPPGVEQLMAARIVVAWKDCPEARRAIMAALPFIKRADQVFVASAGGDARFQGTEEISWHIARHGAHVTTHLLNASPGEEADEILRFARRQDADMVVMGAYGHSRLREWLFGGATRHILQATPACCLMSH